MDEPVELVTIPKEVWDKTKELFKMSSDLNLRLMDALMIEIKRKKD